MTETDNLCHLNLFFFFGLTRSYRDIKPLNIMIQDLNGALIYKIGDFGISKEIAMDLLIESAPGTPAYFSPEQLMGECSVHSFSVYSCHSFVRSFPLFVCLLVVWLGDFFYMLFLSFFWFLFLFLSSASSLTF